MLAQGEGCGPGGDKRFSQGLLMDLKVCFRVYSCRGGAAQVIRAASPGHGEVIQA
jgi:hypothetical protein